MHWRTLRVAQLVEGAATQVWWLARVAHPKCAAGRATRGAPLYHTPRHATGDASALRWTARCASLASQLVRGPASSAWSGRAALTVSPRMTSVHLAPLGAAVRSPLQARRPQTMHACAPPVQVKQCARKLAGRAACSTSGARFSAPQAAQRAGAGLALSAAPRTAAAPPSQLLAASAAVCSAAQVAAFAACVAAVADPRSRRRVLCRMTLQMWPGRTALVAWGPACAVESPYPLPATRPVSDVQARPGRRSRAGGAVRLRRRRAAEQPHLLRRRLGLGAGADAEGGRNSSLTLFAQAVRGWLTFAAAAALQVFTKYLKTKAWDVRVLVRPKTLVLSVRRCFTRTFPDALWPRSRSLTRGACRAATRRWWWASARAWLCSTALAAACLWSASPSP